MKKAILVLSLVIVTVVSYYALPPSSCTVRASCGPNPNDFVECTSNYNDCERGAGWVKCDGEETKC